MQMMIIQLYDVSVNVICVGRSDIAAVNVRFLQFRMVHIGGGHNIIIHT